MRRRRRQSRRSCEPERCGVGSGELLDGSREARNIPSSEGVMLNRNRCRSRSIRRGAAMGAAACALLTVQAARADSIAVTAVQDATLIEDPSGRLASGSGPAIFAGRIATTSQSLRRALVRFDVAAVVPPDSTISEVRL